MNPFIFDRRIDGILLSSKASVGLCNVIEREGIQILTVPDNPLLPVPIRDHPDMSLHPLDYSNFVVAKNMLGRYERLLAPFKIRCLPSTSVPMEPYPMDVSLNIARIGEYYLHNDSTDASIQQLLVERGYRKLNIRQGYSKCSTLILKYDTIITTDKGIHRCVQLEGMHSHLLPAGYLELEGYDTGLIGGCGGMLDRSTILFTGDPQRYRYGEALLTILEAEAIRPLYPVGERMTDLGSLIGIYDINGGLR